MPFFPNRIPISWMFFVLAAVVAITVARDGDPSSFLENIVTRPATEAAPAGQLRLIMRTVEPVPVNRAGRRVTTDWEALDEAFSVLRVTRARLLYARAGLGWVYRLDVGAPVSARRAESLLAKERRVVFSEPVTSGLFMEPVSSGIQQFTPNDPLFQNRTNPLDLRNQQWNLFGRDPFDPANPSAGVSGIRADAAWVITRGREDVVAAVLDSGVDYSNPDLRRKIWINRGELTGVERPDPQDNGVLTRVALQSQGDGRDNDGDGFIDNFSGWDFVDNTNNEFDKTYFGHGTGRAGIIAADTDNAIGIAGIAPASPVMNVRVGETFIVSSDRLAQGVIFAADHGSRVICMALGAMGNSRMLREALNYARGKNVFIAAAMANEFAYHTNYPTTYDPAVGVGAVIHDVDFQGGAPSGDNTFKKKASFSNWGGHLQVVAPTDSLTTRQVRPNEDRNDPSRSFGRSSGTSTAVAHLAGVALLVCSRGRDLGLELSAEEIRQIIDRTADDVVGTQYGCRPGWDQWTGYGRLNAQAAVALVDNRKIPPEAFITGPDWYATVPPQPIAIRGYVNARFAPGYRYTIEMAQGPLGGGFGPAGDGGLDPAESDFRLRFASDGSRSDPNLSSSDLTERLLFQWDASNAVAGSYTIRLRVIDDRGNAGEHRKVIFIRPDPDLLPGFPVSVAQSSGDSSVALADLNGDRKDEIIFTLSSGEVYAVDQNAFPITGFPVTTGQRRSGLDNSPALLSGQVELIRASIVSSAAVGDIDGNGRLDIVVGGIDGKLYVWNGSGQPLAGFPVTTGGDIIASPALGDLDGDGRLEIVVGASDQRLYAWHGDGALLPGFPVLLGAPVSDPQDRVIASSPALGDLDGDGKLDIVTGTNQVADLAGHPLNFPSAGLAYAVNGQGVILSGWPVRVGSVQADGPVPVIGRGVAASPVLVDLNKDGRVEVILSAVAGTPEIFDGRGRRLGVALPWLGLGNNVRAPRAFGVPPGVDQLLGPSNGAVADLDRDGVLDYLAGSVQANLVAALDSKIRVPFDHLLGAWSMSLGLGVEFPVANYPRRVEGWQFINGPIVADIDDDGLPDAIDGTSGMFLHAFNARGQEPARWPKFTGGWLQANPAVGDIDGDGKLDVVAITRSGVLFAWRTTASASEPQPWPKFRRDLRNTGNYNAR